MFRQMIWTLFIFMEQHDQLWRKVKSSVSVPAFDHRVPAEPELVKVNSRPAHRPRFKLGFKQFGALWKEIFCPDCFAHISEVFHLPKDALLLPHRGLDTVLYELAATFHLPHLAGQSHVTYGPGRAPVFRPGRPPSLSRSGT